MKIVLASSNKKKIQEIETLLGEIPSIQAEVLSLRDIGFTGDIVEDGDSFAANALIKASAVASLGYIGIADDSGLTVDALGGAPGIYSARYAGEPSDDGRNNEKLLAALADVPDGERGAAYVCVIACVLPRDMEVEIPPQYLCRTREGLRAFVLRGECRGRILRDYRGEGGFGYDPLFYSEEAGDTFAMIPPEAKHAISHRGHAMRAFGEVFARVFKNRN